MIRPSEIDPISITGRVAFAITCLERVVKHLQVENERLDGLIAFLWTFVSATRLDSWEMEVVERYPFDDYLEPCATWYGYAHLPHEEQELLWKVIFETIEGVALGNLYSGYVSSTTREPTLRIAGLLESHGIPLPPLDPFRRSKATDGNGWGDSVPASFFRF